MEVNRRVHLLEPDNAQQALVGSIYGQQQQQLQAVQQALSNGGNLNNERLSYLSNFSTGWVVERNPDVKQDAK